MYNAWPTATTCPALYVIAPAKGDDHTTRKEKQLHGTCTAPSGPSTHCIVSRVLVLLEWVILCVMHRTSYGQEEGQLQIEGEYCSPFFIIFTLPWGLYHEKCYPSKEPFTALQILELDEMIPSYCMQPFGQSWVLYNEGLPTTWAARLPDSVGSRSWDRWLH